MRGFGIFGLFAMLALAACAKPSLHPIWQGQLSPGKTYRLQLEPTEPAACYAYLDCTLGREDADCDGLLALADDRRVLAQDDDAGPLLSPVIAGPMLVAGQRYRLLWRSQEEARFPCRLFVCLLPDARLGREQEPNNAMAAAAGLSYYAGVSGQLPPGDEDWFAFQAQAGQSVCALCRQWAGDSKQPVRTDLRLLDAQGRVRALGDNTQAQANAVGSIHVSRTGLYYLRIANPMPAITADYTLVLAGDDPKSF